MPASTPHPHEPLGRQPLSHDRVVRAAVELIDREGLDALTMRRLGTELGVEAMALYKHVPNKAALLDAAVDLLLDELNEEGPPPADGRAALETLARRHRRLEGRHPGAYALFADMPATAYLAARPAVEQIMAALVRDGFTPQAAGRALRLVVRFTIGFALTRPRGGVLLDSGDALAPILARLTDPAEEDGLFEAGLAALLDGLTPSD